MQEVSPMREKTEVQPEEKRVERKYDQSDFFFLNHINLELMFKF